MELGPPPPQAPSRNEATSSSLNRWVPHGLTATIPSGPTSNRIRRSDHQKKTAKPTASADHRPADRPVATPGASNHPTQQTSAFTTTTAGITNPANRAGPPTRHTKTGWVRIL